MPTGSFCGARNQLLHVLEGVQQLARRDSGGLPGWLLEEAPPQQLGLPYL